MGAETWRLLGGCLAGWAGQRLRRLSADQQLVRFTLVNTNCSELIKVSHVSPKAPLPPLIMQPLQKTRKNKHNMSLYLAPLRLASVSLLCESACRKEKPATFTRLDAIRTSALRYRGRWPPSLIETRAASCCQPPDG